MHTHGSVLLAIGIHASLMPGKEIAKISLPAAPEPSDWLRAVLVITVAVAIVASLAVGFAFRPRTIPKSKPFLLIAVASMANTY